MAINTLTVSGNIGRDCEVRQSQSGTSFANFPLPVTSGYGDNEKTTWVTCKLIGKRAEGKLPGMLVKGQKVVVTGRLESSEWVDKENNKRLTIELFVNDLEFAGGQQARRDTSQSDMNNSGVQEPRMGDSVPF
jgi:single-strand DNA-binding protein